MQTPIMKETKLEQKLAITHIPLSKLYQDPKNPRLHTDRQIGQIARSIESFGFNVPVLIDAHNKVLAGHGRVLACQKLGWQEVPTIRLDHLTLAQARAFAIADNRLTENSVWDDCLLAESFKELAALNLDFSIESTGFTMGEIDLRIENLSTPAEDKPDPADELPDIANTVPVTQPGDLWLLDRHRLLCGNALEGRSYYSLTNGEHAAVIFTDPPYNVKIDGHASGLGNIRHREFAMAAGEMTEAEFVSFLTRVCSLMARHSIDGAIHFVCMDWRHAGELLEAGKLAYTELKNVCVWVKDNAGMGSLYRSQHEFIFVFKHGRAAHHNNVQLGQYGRSRSNVWHYPGANSLSRSDEGKLLAMHPTVKPVALVADALLDCSARGDIVLDPFMGSGTTLLAAERVGRICYGIEIDPLYSDTIIRRWQKWTGGQAIHAESGKRFDDRAVEAGVRHD